MLGICSWVYFTRNDLVQVQVNKFHLYTPKLIITKIKIRIFLIDFQIGTGLYQKLFLKKYFFFYCALCRIRILRSGKNRRENNGWEWFVFVKRFYRRSQKWGNFLFSSKWIQWVAADGVPTAVSSTSWIRQWVQLWLLHSIIIQTIPGYVVIVSSSAQSLDEDDGIIGRRGKISKWCTWCRN